MTRRKTASAPSREISGRPFTVMVVDDEDDLRESIGELLAAAQYAVVCVENGNEALTHLRSNGTRPDLIVLDLMMPRMDGWEFREAQRSDPELASIPVVVMTASRNHRPIDAEQILYKPVDPDVLMTVVDRHRAGDPSPESSRPLAELAAPAPAAGSAAFDAMLFSDRFVDMLGHDLRNPISTMYLTGTLLSGQARDEETAEHAGRILNVVQRMDLTVSHLLHFLRICLGQDAPMARTRTDMGEVCRRVVRSLTRSTGRAIDLVVAQPMEGNWDRERLELLVSTLVREACDQDRSQGAIVVKAYPSGETVRLEIVHRGSHAPERRIPEFVRNKEGARSELEDECMRVGLGMAIARRIVRAHHGEIRIDSDPSTVTCVTVDLPTQWTN
ncbi:MAG TPA: hybrid sensor histidine kinase/response regulator [Candidatus Krumholzibacteria bacterium]|nr:hybrid sensor histidine kinase/response regulator [Candidatus Krumholzibacteria bacterium]